MEITISRQSLLGQLYKQLSNFFEISAEEKAEIDSCLEETLQKCATNFESSSNKYFANGFNPYHSVMYMIFLYYLSNILYKRNTCAGLCDKVYYLNKIMNGVDLFYAIDLPAHFGAEHPLGTIMGRAQYGDHFIFLQGCTVGGSRDEEGNIHYPIIGNNVCMYANSMILGRCNIGNNVDIGAGAVVKNQDIPANSIVFGESPNLIIKQKKNK